MANHSAHAVQVAGFRLLLASLESEKTRTAWAVVYTCIKLKLGGMEGGGSKIPFVNNHEFYLLCTKLARFGFKRNAHVLLYYW